MPANVQTMAYYGEVPWHGLGTPVPKFEDYKQPQQEELPDQRLERTWFGGGADIKLRALEKAQELSARWN